MHGRIANRSRVYAGVVDVAVIALIIGGAAFAPSVVHQKPVASIGFACIGALLAELYTLFDAFSASGTPGKMLLRLRVTRSDGRRADDHELLLRWLIKFIPLHVIVIEFAWLTFPPLGDSELSFLIRIALLLPELVAVIVCTGYLLMFDDLRQTLHDVLTDTAVFDAAVDIRSNGFHVLPAATEPVIMPGHTLGHPTDDSGRSAPPPSIPLARRRSS